MGSARVRFSNTDSTPYIIEVCTSSRYVAIRMFSIVLYNSLQVEFGCFSYYPLLD